jgi:hypothetical protein
LEKKYYSLVNDVNKMMDEAEKRALENLAKMKGKNEDKLGEIIKRKRNVPMEELALLKDC